jgi:hypothetical protein
MSYRVSHGASGAIRRFAGWVVRGSVGHPMLDGIDYWNELKDSPSQMETCFAIFVNVLELDSHGEPINEKYAERRAATWLYRALLIRASALCRTPQAEGTHAVICAFDCRRSPGGASVAITDSGHAPWSLIRQRIHDTSPPTDVRRARKPVHLSEQSTDLPMSRPSAANGTSRHAARGSSDTSRYR